MNINGLRSYLNLPSGYYNLDYDDPLRLTLRQEAAYEAMVENSEALEDLELGDIIPKVFEKTSDGVITS